MSIIRRLRFYESFTLTVGKYSLEEGLKKSIRLETISAPASLLDILRILGVGRRSWDNLRWFLHQSFDVMLERARVCGFIARFSTTNFCSRDHRTTASGTSRRCSFGSVTVSDSVFPGHIGRAHKRRQPVHERFHTVPYLWNGPALCVTEHCTGKRQKG